MEILTAPSSFESKSQAIDYINQCEKRFHEDVVALSQKLISIPGLRLIGLTGPTCAGKTTAATILIEQMQSAGRKVHLVSVDDFFRDQPHGRNLMNEPDGKSRLDFDSIDALDFDLFSGCLSELMTKGKTNVPRYDLGAGRRIGFVELLAPDQTDVILIEGIQVVYPEISALLHQYIYHSIYIDVGSSLAVGNVVFQPEEIRLMRRLVRDYHFRSSEAEFTFFLWHSVRANEEKNIFPHVHLCDSCLDSLMGYEIGLLRPYLEIVLGQLNVDSEYRNRAKDILKNTANVMALDCCWLPNNALYREFIPVS